MRNYIIAALCVLTVSCGNANHQDAASSQTDTPVAEAGMHESSNGPIDPKTKVDPVCGMEWDTAWVDLTVYNGDTIRFCGEGCKMAFEARPAKYVVAKQ